MKGDTRRPSEVTKLEQYRRWEQTFGKKPVTKKTKKKK